MADVLIPINGGLSKKIVDLGDGIGAELVAFDGSPTGSGSAATTVSEDSVASSITSVTILAANTDRKFAKFRNDSTVTAYIKAGTGATASSVIRLLPQAQYYADDYTGVYTAIWESANGFMRIVEGV